MKFVLTTSKKYCMYTPKEIDFETRLKRHTFSPVSDVDAEKSWVFFSAEVKIPPQILLNFLSFMNKFL